MIKSALKGLTIAFGGGLALGAGFKLAQRAARQGEFAPSLDRLSKLEQQLAAVESALGEGASPARWAEQILDRIEPRFSAHIALVKGLRTQMEATERSSAAELSGLTQRMGELESSLPRMIDSGMSAALQSVETRLEDSMDKLQSRSMEACIQVIEEKLAARMSGLESDVAGQAQAIGRLRTTSSKNEETVRKLVSEIQKLARTAAAMPNSTTSQPAPRPAPEHVPAARAHPYFLDRSAGEPNRPNCPKCGSPDVRTSAKRGFVDALLAPRHFTAYRCRGCGERFRTHPAPAEILHDALRGGTKQMRQTVDIH